MEVLILTQIQQFITTDLLKHIFPLNLNNPEMDDTREILEEFFIYQSSCEIKIEEITE